MLVEDTTKKRNILTRIFSFIAAIIVIFACLISPSTIFASNYDLTDLSDEIDQVYQKDYNGPDPSEVLGGANWAGAATTGTALWAAIENALDNKSLADGAGEWDWSDLSPSAQNEILAAAYIADSYLGLDSNGQNSSIQSIKGHFADEGAAMLSAYKEAIGADENATQEEITKQATESAEKDEASNEKFTYYDLINKKHRLDGNPPSYEDIIALGARWKYEIASGADFWTFLTDPGGALKAWLVGGTASSYAGAITSISDSVSQARDLLTRPLSGTHTVMDGNHLHTSTVNDVNKIIYKTVKTISQDIMTPIAGVILAFVFAYQIYELVCERNNMNDVGVGTFIQLFIKMFLAIIVVMNAWTLTEWVFDIGNWIVDQAIPVIDSNAGTGNLLDAVNTAAKSDSVSNGTVLTWYFAYLICVNDTIGFGDILVMLLQGLIINIGMLVISVIVSVIVYVRMIEIYLYCAFAPIPLATLPNRTWQQVGLNFIRSVAALAFQAFIIILCLGIFEVMVDQTLFGDNGIISNTDELVSQMWAVIGYSIILVFCLFKSGSLSKSIMSAH